MFVVNLITKVYIILFCFFHLTIRGTPRILRIRGPCICYYLKMVTVIKYLHHTMPLIHNSIIKPSILRMDGLMDGLIWAWYNPWSKKM